VKRGSTDADMRHDVSSWHLADIDISANVRSAPKAAVP
jgi:hypothetical protein